MKRIILLLILTLFISGCNGIAGFGSSSSQNNANEYYRTGSQGLTFEVMSNMPPSKIYDDEVLDVMIKVNNKGATDIKSGSNSRLYLSGYDENIVVGMSRTEPVGNLEGKSMYNDVGEFNTYDFQGTIKELNAKGIDKYNFNLMVTGCYDYSTIAEPTVCIDPDPYSKTSRNKACNGFSNPSVGTQGAPIAITSIEVEPMKERTKFKIFVKNIGSGTVYKPGYTYLDKCDPYHSQGLEYSDIDVVRLSKLTVANLDIRGTCKPMKDDYIRLIDGQGYIVCELVNQAGPAFTTPMTIALEYGYRETITKPVEIISTP